MAVRTSRRMPPQDPAARARELFLSILTPSEREQFRKHSQYVDITGSEGGKYRVWVTRGSVGNIEARCETKVGTIFRHNVKPGCLLCAHPPTLTLDQIGRAVYLPHLDVVATQVLAIKADEGKFLRTANLYARMEPS